MAEIKRNAPSGAPAAEAPPLARSGAREPAVERSLADLAAMGEGQVAYLRAFRAGELAGIFPQVAELHPALQLFALFGADGTPLMLADSREAVTAAAFNHELELARVH